MAIAMTAEIVRAALEATAAKINPSDAISFRAGDGVVSLKRGVGHVTHVGFEEIAGHRSHLIRKTPAIQARWPKCVAVDRISNRMRSD